MVKRIIAIGALFCASASFGAGFQVLEQGANNIGSAMAGATTNASSDASAAFWNPSAVMFTQTKVGDVRVDAAMNFVIPSFEFEDDGRSVNPMGRNGNDGGNAGDLELIPNFFAVYRFAEDFALTFSMTAPFGIGTEYDDNWIGRFQGIESRVTTYDINPSIAWKVFDWLSVSAGASAQWLHAKLTQAVYLGYGMETRSQVTGDSWSAGANIGVTINYMEGGRIGFSWRTKVSHDLTGNLKIAGVGHQAVNANLTLPQTFNVGVYQRLGGDFRNFALMLDYSYTCWSSFESLVINSDATGSPVSYTNEDWKNVSRVAAGVHFYPDSIENLVFRFGVAWDESPVPNSARRTVRIPCSDRIWLTTGVGYEYKGISLSVAYGYIIFYDDSDINAVEAPNNIISGKYTGHSHIVSVQVGYAW